MSHTQPLPIDLTKLLGRYQGEWVALSRDEKTVLGHGTSLDAALSQAKQRGEDRPIVIKAPDQYSAFLL